MAAILYRRQFQCIPNFIFDAFKRPSSTLVGNKLESISVFAWGSGAHGVLGQGNLIPSDQFEPVEVPHLPPNVVGIGAGSFHSLAWTSNGQLYTWGRNKEWQLGRPLAATEIDYSIAPELVPSLDQEIIKATGSGVATFAITKQGELLVAGTSKRGQLGLGKDQTQSKSFTPVALPRTNGGKVTSVAAGWGHAVALVEDDKDTKVYSWGWPANGRLGHSFASESIEEETEEVLTTRCVYEPKEIELLRGVKITDIACGMDTTYCITQDGRLISFGDNSLGQLGRPERENGEHTEPKDASCWEVYIQRRSDPTQHVKFRSIAAGLGHVIAVTNNGNLVSWGWNGAAQLGLGEPGEGDEVVLQPKFIFGVSQNRQSRVAAGRVHSVLVTDDIAHDRSATPIAYGRSWPCLTMCHTWGSAANGRLGTGTYEDAPFPELMSELDGEMILDIACGMDHTLSLVGREGEAAGPRTAFQ